MSIIYKAHEITYTCSIWSPHALASSRYIGAAKYRRLTFKHQAPVPSHFRVSCKILTASFENT